MQRIGFTAVKGGRHIGYDHVHLDRCGPVGDRAFCLLDRTRSVVLRTVQHPTLLQAVSRWQDGALSVELPDERLLGVPVGTGQVRRVDYWGRDAQVEIVDGPWASGFSRLLGQEVVLARPVTSGEIVYGAAVSIVTTESLRWLGARVGHEVEPERFRSTLVIESGPRADRAESAWVGRRLTVGRARLEVTGSISRCAVIDLDPVTGLRDRSLLTSIAGDAGGDVTFGVDAVVTSPGQVRLGDPVALAAD